MTAMNPQDLWINLLGIAYGATLISVSFVRGSVVEALRVDALLMPGHSERSRPLNLLVGLLVVGYASFALLR